MVDPHDPEAQAEAVEAPPTLPRRLLGLGVEVAVVVACVIALAEWLWLGHLLLPFGSWVVVLLAVALLLLRRQPGRAAACVLGMLLVAWPWLRVAFEPAAASLAADAPVSLRVAAADLRGWTGSDPAAALAALAATGADVIAILTPPDGPLTGASFRLPGYSYKSAEPLRRREDPAATHDIQAWLVLVARQRPVQQQVHFAPGSDGLLLSAQWQLASGPTALVLVPAFGAGDHPQRFVRQLPLIQRSGELSAAHAGAVVLCAPRAWDRAAPRWRRLAKAAELRLPAAGLPTGGPIWLPRLFDSADTVIAAKHLAFGQVERTALPGTWRSAVVVDLGPED